MSVLPLVFPSNISCFSRGSYKEELARKRELPVPPLPKRSGIWARSNEDLQGLTSSGSVSPVSSDSSASNIVRFTSDTCLPRTVFRNDREILNRGDLLPDFLNTQMTEIASSEEQQHQLASRDLVSSSSESEEEKSRDSEPREGSAPHVGSSSPASRYSPVLPETATTAVTAVAAAGIAAAAPASTAPSTIISSSISRSSSAAASGAVAVSVRLQCDDNDVAISEEQDLSTEEAEESEVSVAEECQEATAETVASVVEEVDRAAAALSEAESQRFLGSQISLAIVPALEPDPAVPGSPASPPSPTRIQSTERLNTMFRKAEKGDKKTGGEIFRAALERLSFRSSKKKKGSRNKAETAKNEPASATAAAAAATPPVEVGSDALLEKSEKVSENHTSPVKPKQVEDTTTTTTTVTPAQQQQQPPQTPLAYKPPLPPGRRRPPASATWEQSRPINQLDSALKQFRTATAESRENLNLSKPDLSAIEAEVARSHPGQSSRSRRGSDAASSNGNAFKLKLVAPPKNNYVDSQWEKLSASMASLNGYRMGRERPPIEPREGTKGSTQSLMQGEEEGGAGGPTVLPRTQSVTVLNHVNNKNTSIEVPENRLQQLTPHQARIRDSMERLNIPSWYSNRSNENGEGLPAAAPPTPRRSTGGWRRHVSHSRSATPATEADNNRSRWSSRTLPLSYRTHSHSSLSSPSSTTATSTTSTASTTASPRQPYLGWRSQERLDIGPAYLASPAMRLASTALPVPVPPSRSNTLPPSTRIALSKNIRQVSEEIQDYCKSGEPASAGGSSSSSAPITAATADSSVSSSPSPPPKPIEAWSDTPPLHQNGRGHMIVA